MIDNVSFLPTILGTIVGFILGIGGKWLEWKLIGEKNFYEEQNNEKEKETSLYYRKNFSHFAPFLAIIREYTHIIGETHLLGGALTNYDVERFNSLFPRFRNAYDEIIDSGHLALLPESISSLILKYGQILSKLTGVEESPNEKDLTDAIINHIEIYYLTTNIYSLFRTLLGIESLDGKLDKLLTTYGQTEEKLTRARDSDEISQLISSFRDSKNTLNPSKG